MSWPCNKGALQRIPVPPPYNFALTYSMVAHRIYRPAEPLWRIAPRRARDCHIRLVCTDGYDPRPGQGSHGACTAADYFGHARAPQKPALCGRRRSVARVSLCRLCRQTSKSAKERRCARSALRGVRSRDVRARDAGSGFRSCSDERGGGLRRWCALITKRLLILTLLSAPMASEPGTGVSSALGVVSSRAAARPAGAPPGHYVDAAVDAAAWARSQTPNRPCLAAD